MLSSLSTTRCYSLPLSLKLLIARAGPVCTSTDTMKLMGKKREGTGHMSDELQEDGDSVCCCWRELSSAADALVFEHVRQGREIHGGVTMEG